ncbi:MAG: hypothetical protein ACI353_02275 [Alloprevotella sp.]
MSKGFIEKTSAILQLLDGRLSGDVAKIPKKALFALPIAPCGVILRPIWGFFPLEEAATSVAGKTSAAEGKTSGPEEKFSAAKKIFSRPEVSPTYE